MAKLQDNLLRTEPWSGMIMGNYALARAMIEARVQVATTYPGSPTPEIAAALSSIPEDKRPYYFEYSTNEKVALEVAAGASFNGRLSTVFFKSVGLNVVADSLIQLPLMRLIGGMVVILGDDPGINSSQNEQDNRHFSRMAYIPMFEPATPQEAYEMFLEAARLSRERQLPVFLRLTTHVNHFRQVVRFGGWDGADEDWTPRFAVENGPYIPIASTVFPLKRRALANVAELVEYSDQTAATELLTPNGEGSVDGAKLALISHGLPALGLLENLDQSEHPVTLLKLGMTYPLPRARICDLLARHDEVLVVEELDRILENEIKVICYEEGLDCKVRGRTDPEDLMGELGPERTQKLLAETWPAAFEPPPAPPAAPEVAVPPRLPQFCPGCGHRSAFHAIKAALADDAITVADIGCHTMAFMPPYEMGQLLLCMGHSPATGAGLALRNESRKVVSFMGDSTMFHAALPAIVNATVRDHDLTLVLLENGTTAMTGHQPRPGSGEVGDKIKLVEMFETLGVKLIRSVDAYDQAGVTAAVKEATEHKGFAVVIAHHPCMLKFTRDQRRKMPGFKLPPVEIDQQTCDRSRVCIAEFGCVSFQVGEDGAIGVSDELCIGDGSCIQTCPVSAISRPKPGGK